jgi:chromodomain-helicase-DNA-binding protein 7
MFLNYLYFHSQKMERREKIEQVVRERERLRFEQIPKKWSRRDENEFLRVLTGYGIDLQQHTSVPMPDWSR